MRMSKYLLSIIFYLIFICTDTFAQDVAFSQFYANPMYLNPAFAGAVRCPRFVTSARKQWPNFYNPYTSYMFSYDQHIDKLSGGLGIIASSDNSGDGTIISNSISAIYSYQLTISKDFSLKAGLQATYQQKKLNWSNLDYGDQIDSRNGFIYQTAETNDKYQSQYVDVSAGVLGFGKKYFFGFATHHLTQPDESFVGPKNTLPMKFTGHAGATFQIGNRNDETSISPNILFVKQSGFQQLNIGFYSQKQAFVGGLWYRSNDAIIILVGVQLPKFRFGYSYDMTISKAASASTFGAHEISMSVQLKCKSKKKKFNTLVLPYF